MYEDDEAIRTGLSALPANGYLRWRRALAT